MNRHTSSKLLLLAIPLAAVAGLSSVGCKKKTETTSTEPQGAAQPAGGKKKTIQDIGSDTMVNLAQAWAEEYAKVNPAVSIEVSGGGTGQGVAALINGTADIANASRKLEPEEADKAKKAHGSDPVEYLVGYDALSVFVHKSNPLNEISIDELGEIYREGGKLDSWADVGVKAIPGAQDNKIVRVSRQNNSGTYHYFREVVVGKKSDYKPGSLDMNGSKDVVELIARTPTAIGYSGLGYATPAVKILKVSKKKGEPGVAPSIATTLDKTYPIARPLFMYTPGKPSAEVKGYLDWVMSPPGQKIVEQTGYVPLPSK
jgi:phosphate transport system substrate-binding protein